MTLLKNLIANARDKNRKKARSQTNHTYYRRKRAVVSSEVQFEVRGSDDNMGEFLSTVEYLIHDPSVSVEIIK